MEQPYERRRLGSTSLVVSRVCLGSAGWGDGEHPTRAESVETAVRILQGPYNFADTSNNYGSGEAEKRWGLAIAELGGLPDDFVLETKLDRDMKTDDFSWHRMHDSLEESLERLGLSSFPMLYLHDPEHTTFEYAMSPHGPVEALLDMKARGVVRHVGISGGPVDMLIQYLDTGLFEAVITHNRYTLVDRSASRLLDRARSLGVGVLNAAPFGGGLLARYPIASGEYNYEPASEPVRAAAEAIGRTCHEAGIPVAAAALQWSLREPRIDATIVGPRTAAEVDAVAELASTPIDADLWKALEALAPGPEHWIDPPPAAP